MFTFNLFREVLYGGGRTLYMINYYFTNVGFVLKKFREEKVRLGDSIHD